MSLKKYFNEWFWSDEMDVVDGIDWNGLAAELNVELVDGSTVGFNNPYTHTSEPNRRDYLFFKRLKDGSMCIMVNGDGDVDVVDRDDYDIVFP